jgi:hypothetical protein
MSEIGTQRAHSSDGADWNRAWDETSGLSMARGITEALKLSQEPMTPGAGPDRRPEQPTGPGAPIAPDPVARGMAEIEQAATALRREEPRLEPESPGFESKAELQTARSVWILIAVIWVSVASAVSCAIGAAFLLFG